MGAHDSEGQCRLGTQAWTIFVIESLILLHLNGAPATAPTSGSEAQWKALKLMYGACADLCRPDKGKTGGDPQKAAGRKLERYWCDAVAIAVDLTLEQVVPTLPDVGVAGSVPIVNVIDGQLRDQIRDPPSVMLPESEWPLKPPRATNMLKEKAE